MSPNRPPPPRCCRRPRKAGTRRPSFARSPTRWGEDVSRKGAKAAKEDLMRNAPTPGPSGRGPDRPSGVPADLFFPFAVFAPLRETSSDSNANSSRRQPDGELAAASRAVADGPDRAAVQLDEALHQRQ